MEKVAIKNIDVAKAPIKVKAVRRVLLKTGAVLIALAALKITTS